MRVPATENYQPAMPLGRWYLGVLCMIYYFRLEFGDEVTVSASSGTRCRVCTSISCPRTPIIKTSDSKQCQLDGYDLTQPTLRQPTFFPPDPAVQSESASPLHSPVPESPPVLRHRRPSHSNNQRVQLNCYSSLSIDESYVDSFPEPPARQRQ